MSQLKPAYPTHPITEQLMGTQSPVVLVNIFSVDAADADQLLKAREHDANCMKQQPGFVSTQLHRTVGGSTMLLNLPVWETVGHFRAAFTNPEFRASLAAYPDSAVASPHLFERACVPDLCAA